MFFSLNKYSLNITIFVNLVPAVIPLRMYIFLDFYQLHIDNIIHAAFIPLDDHIHIGGHLR